MQCISFYYKCIKNEEEEEIEEEEEEEEKKEGEEGQSAQLKVRGALGTRASSSVTPFRALALLQQCTWIKRDQKATGIRGKGGHIVVIIDSIDSSFLHMLRVIILKISFYL